MVVGDLDDGRGVCLGQMEILVAVPHRELHRAAVYTPGVGEGIDGGDLVSA